MVYVARAARASGAKIWAGVDVFTEREQSQLRAGGLDLSVFNYSLRRQDPTVVAGALGTIEERHPGETIWVQHERG